MLKKHMFSFYILQSIDLYDFHACSSNSFSFYLTKVLINISIVDFSGMSCKYNYYLS